MVAVGPALRQVLRDTLCASRRRWMSSEGRIARIAVSGAGWWGQGWHLPHLHRRSDAKIAAIVETNPRPTSSNAGQQLETTAQLRISAGRQTSVQY